MLVRERGLEPPRPFEHYDLNVAWLPITALAHGFVAILPLFNIKIKATSVIYYWSSYTISRDSTNDNPAPARPPISANPGTLS